VSDAAKIVAGLTEAQRNAVLGKTRWLRTGEAFEWPFGGTVRRMSCTPHKWEATPLGIEVRKLLEAQS
jgi:hypothetical protein